VSTQDKELLSGYLRRRHSVTKLVTQLVFTTKYRRKVLDGCTIKNLRVYFESACKKLECELLEMDGEQDYVHLLIAYSPKLVVSVMVNNLKSVSSRMIRNQNTHLSRIGKGSALWSRSYFACTTGGATIETLRTYIEQQETPK
jgi:putative transposase